VTINQVLVIILRRGWIVLLALLTALIVVAGVVLFVPARYEAVATASIDSDNIDPITETGGGGSVMLMQGNILSLVSSQRVALDVVKRLNLTANPQAEANFRASGSFGRESMEEWMASAIVGGVDPKFLGGTNVLSIKYKSADPNQAALMANAFLASTIDGSVAMKAAEADQIARWSAPQLEELRKELDASREALAAFQQQTNMVAPGEGADSNTSEYMAITSQLSAANAQLTILQTRLASGSTELSNDPADPDLQILAGLKEKAVAADATIDAAKGTFGSANPKMMAEQANLASVRRQIADATEKMKQHLKQRIANTQDQIAALEAEQAKAKKDLIQVQSVRARLNELQHDVAFRGEQLNERERAAAAAKLKSKLTVSDMTVLDKATPPLAPSFPKPMVVIPVGIGAGLALGLLLALLAEATDRRVRFPVDLEYAAAAPFLGSLDVVRRARARVGAPRRALRPA
jgi:uncharacterized protein involved in exopolysaccharide biosynthesis